MKKKASSLYFLPRKNRHHLEKSSKFSRIDGIPGKKENIHFRIDMQYIITGMVYAYFKKDTYTLTLFKIHNTPGIRQRKKVGCRMSRKMCHENMS